MKTLKVKIVQPKSVAKKGGLYTANVDRMEQFLAQSRGTFKERSKLVLSDDGHFLGVLVGPTARARNSK